ncbi:MAG: DNA-directed RNA polymerase subunit alpha [Endomicrobium sp.]|jgi:DNA-directed RNA polymerase subunit alpha|nr:DNA-directed RNA polymerase subunit alpha [Endomicrobium sp.]
MKSINLDELRKVTLDKQNVTDFYSRFIVEPLERGYGHTIGNSLRRILLSSLEGSAIIAVEIEGVSHEFAVIKGIKEDVTQIILNLKKIRLKQLNKKNEEIIYLKIMKPGKITAKNIELNKNIKIMNPEQEIANIDNDTKLNMKLIVSYGKGYVFAEELEIINNYTGLIKLDSLFSPIIKVNYEVQSTRVGQNLNYDKLIIDIWTDGTMTPKKALARSAEILSNNLAIFSNEQLENIDVENKNMNHSYNKNSEILANEDTKFYDQSINVMKFSTRILNSLRSNKINTIKDLITLSKKEIMNFTNFGKRALEEVENKLKELKLSLKN